MEKKRRLLRSLLERADDEVLAELERLEEFTANDLIEEERRRRRTTEAG